MSQKPAPLANLFTSAERAKVIQATGQFPDIPSIKYKYDAVGADKSKQCTEWFTEFLSRTDKDGNKVNLPGIETAAGEYLAANGDKDQQDDRLTDIVSHICEHDLKSRQIITRVGDIVRRLLDRALIIPSLLAENARLCECKPECGPSEPAKPECDAATVAKCCPEDLADDRKLLVEQLSYMALQLKKMTQQLGFVYDPATQSFYNESDDMYKDANSGLKADKTIADSAIHEMLGLETDQIRELWDVLSSAQNNLVYGTLVDLYPEHPSCKDPTVMTSEPLYNISITYDDGSGGPAVPADVAKHKLVWLRLYLKRLDTIVGNAALSAELAGITDAQLQKAVDEFVAIVPGSYKLTFRVPADWFDTLLSEPSRRLIGIRQGNEMVKGPSVGQTALTSIAVRKPNQREMKSIEKLCDPQAFKEVYGIAGTANTSAFLTFDELKSKVIGVPDPEPVDCQGSWADEGNCSEPCGDGVQAEKYTVTTPAENGGQECEAADGDTRSTKTCNMGDCAPPPPPEPPKEAKQKPAEESSFDVEERQRQDRIKEAARKAAELAATRAINYYVRARPLLEMDYGATAAQGMSAGSHNPEKPNALREAAEDTAKNIQANFPKHFSDGKGAAGPINALTRFKKVSDYCLDFTDVFNKKEFELFHGHEVEPGFKRPSGKDAKVSFNLVWDDREIFDDERQGSVKERIQKNSDQFLTSVWPNVNFFFGSDGSDPQYPARPPSNVCYVAYGASGAGKTQTTGAILARWLKVVAEKGTMANYSISILSDYLNRCYDFLSEPAQQAYEALRRENEYSGESSNAGINKALLKYILNEQLVRNKETGEVFFNAHALTEDILAQSDYGKQLLNSKKTIAKRIGERLGVANATQANVGKAIFREGNEQFAVGYAKDKKSPSNGIEVERDSAGAVDTQKFLSQFASVKLTEIMKMAQADTETDPVKQADKLWGWLETRINCFRRRGNTGLNKASSRSHAIYILQDDTIAEATAPGKIFVLADFAGTEKLDFLVPKETQEHAKSVIDKRTGQGYSWFSVAIPPQGGTGVVDSTAKSKGVVPVVMNEQLAKDKVPAGVITQLAKATFLQEASSNGLVEATGMAPETLWKEIQKIHFLSKNVMLKLPPLQQESHQITRSLEQFKSFLRQHRKVVESGAAKGVECTQFTVDHHKAVNINNERIPVYGFQQVVEPCLLVQKLLCALITLDSSLVVLGAMAPRVTDDLNSYNTATFISDCQCGDDGSMQCPA